MAEPGTINLSPQDLQLVLGILETYVAERPVYVFGSRATGKARRRSDLDLAVGGGPIPLALQADLADAFDQSDLPIEVDVVELETASDSFRSRIERDWLPLPLATKAESTRELVTA